MAILAGRTAVVTGAAQGIGLAIAERFIQEGARVAILDRDIDKALEATHMLEEMASTGVGFEMHGDDMVVRAYGCDVSDERSVSSSFEQLVADFGGVDILVNNAGVTRDASLSNMTVEQFRTVVDVHLTGAWLCTKAAAEVMRSQQSGCVVNISSMSGKVGIFGQTNYSAAKAGLVGLTKASAKELARFGVRVNAVQPGLIDTPMTRAMPEQAWADKLREIPLARAGQPHEVASCVAFLCSDMASYVTGGVLEVAGGRHM